MPRRLSQLLPVALLFLSPISASLAQSAGGALAPELDAALHYYLGKDCAVEEEPKALERLLKLSASEHNVVVPVLGRTFLDGPNSAEIATVRRSLEDQWQRRKERLDRGAVSGLSEKQVRYLTDITKQNEYVEAGLSSYVFQVRQRSLIALNRIDSREAQAAIANAKKIGSKELTAVILATPLSPSRAVAPEFTR